jgi:hypothetical protein
MRWLLVIGLAGCGPPIARNLPQPNTGAIAGVAAGAAAAATLAAPDAAAKKQETKKNSNADKKPQKVKETVPAGVLDRVDQKQQGPGAGTGSDGDTKPLAEPNQP